MVNARDLHVALWVDRDFSDWIKDRIEEYDLLRMVTTSGLRQHGRKPHGEAARPSITTSLSTWPKNLAWSSGLPAVGPGRGEHAPDPHQTLLALARALLEPSPGDGQHEQDPRPGRRPGPFPALPSPGRQRHPRMTFRGATKGGRPPPLCPPARRASTTLKAGTSAASSPVRTATPGSTMRRGGTIRACALRVGKLKLGSRFFRTAHWSD